VPQTQKEWIRILQDSRLDSCSRRQASGQDDQAGERPITLPENKRRAYSKGFEAALRRQVGL